MTQDYGQSLLNYHQACLRMMKADYCGDWTPHTRDGIQVQIDDLLGIQTKISVPELTFEGAWNEPLRSALYRSALYRLAPFRLVPLRLAPLKSVILRSRFSMVSSVSVINPTPQSAYLAQLESGLRRHCCQQKKTGVERWCDLLD